MTWFYKDKEVTDEDIQDYVAFVYLITNNVNGKRYIGKKLFQFTKTSKKTKTSTKRKKVKTDSGWKNYFGSNKTLQADVIKYGKENFKREILHFCKTKGTANFLEVKEQIIYNALEDPEFYNDWIIVKVSRSHIKL